MTTTVVLTPIGSAPPPDPLRVADLARTIDPHDPGGCGALAETERAALLTVIDRALAETRACDLGECVLLLNHIREQLVPLNPAVLEPPTGMAAWFGRHAEKVQAFRARFETAARGMAQAASDLQDAGAAVARRDGVLDALWTELRDAVLVLDERIVAALTVLDRPHPEGEPGPALRDRTLTLAATRNTAVRVMPLLRQARNIDAATADRLTEAVRAVTEWRTVWARTLRAPKRRFARFRPDPAALASDGETLGAALAVAARALSQARARRRETEARLSRLAAQIRRGG